jgi:Zn-dependent protease with chaperone function
LLVGLTERQMIAVLARELGHYSGRHTALSGVTYRGAEAVQRVIARLRGDTLLAKLFSVYGKLYAAVSRTVNRRQELEADQFMAQIAGKQAAASALRELAPVDGVEPLRRGVPFSRKGRPTPAARGVRRLLGVSRRAGPAGSDGADPAQSA